MDKPNVKWGRILENGNALRVIVEPNLVRIQLGHAGPPTDEHYINSFVLDAEIPLEVKTAYDLARELGKAATEADHIRPRGRKNARTSRDADGWRK